MIVTPSLPGRLATVCLTLLASFSTCVTGADSPQVTPAPELPPRTPPAPPTPRINGPKVYGARPGHPFQYYVPVTGDRPMTITAKNLPAGLTLDKSTGLITGTTPAANTYGVTIIAANALGRDTRDLKIVAGKTIGLTPPLGFNTWNHFYANISDQGVRAQADAMVASGLINHGWSYINLDDGWQKLGILPADPRKKDPGDFPPVRSATGEILPSSTRFPDMQALGDYIHSKGLKFGIYSSPGIRTCAGYAGSLGHEDQDIATYAKWGVDYVKYDRCGYKIDEQYLKAQDCVAKLKPEDAGPLDKASKELYQMQLNPPEKFSAEQEARIKELGDILWKLEHKLPQKFLDETHLKYTKLPYAMLGQSIAKVNRDIFYSFCQCGWGKSWEWAASLGGNSWRTAEDINTRWESIYDRGFVKQKGLESYAGPGHWNDPDMLEVGNSKKLTQEENYTHMTLWSMLASPLLIGCDMTRMSPFILSIFSNDEVLAVNQDELGAQGHLAVERGPHQIWIKPLADGSRAVALFNMGTATETVSVKWDELGLHGPQKVRDLWRQVDLGVQAQGWSATVPSHGAELIRIDQAP